MIEATPTRFCLKCGYVLDGLPEDRCPECGREFDPGDETTWGTNAVSHSWRRVRMVLMILLHPLVLLGFGWYMHYRLTTYQSQGGCIIYTCDPRYFWGLSGLLALLGIVFLCFRRKAGLLLLLGSPVAIYLLIAIFGYATGTGHQADAYTVCISDILSGTHYSICKESRLPIRPAPSALRWDRFHITCNDMVIRKLGEWFGPAPGTYAGRIPGYDEVRDAMKDSVDISIYDLIQDKVIIDGETISLEPGFNQELILTDQDTEELLFFRVLSAEEKEEYIETCIPQIISVAGPPRGLILDQTCVLIEIHEAFFSGRCHCDEPVVCPTIDELREEKGSRVYLFDLKTGVQFAEYSYETSLLLDGVDDE